ncbi:unnamed protein product [Cuscuta europaea]|uniref:TPX2 C-terminal domain-containing protein n=1 Tax=Cuscuta europaea TaxID=41803 RepID=A0A9P0Z931_CUSEU|nr:unnamed protein product [Cuscuta europaea]
MAADSACLIHAFSYASATPNEAKQGNGMHALGESISFGRFMTESLGWEKWSTFSHNKYVEEAERYARPGSVAQKKAFFEAHYKRIAAKKAAAEAALLEQAHLEEDEEESKADSVLKVGDGSKAGVDSIVEDDAQETVSELSEDSQVAHQMEMERPLLVKLNSKKKDEEDEEEEEEVLSSSSSVPVISKKRRPGLSSFRKIMPSSSSSSSTHGKIWNKEVLLYPSPPQPIVSNVIQTQHHLNKEIITIATPIKIPPTPMVRSHGGTILTGADKPTSKCLSSLLNLSDQPAKEPVKLPPPKKVKDTPRVAPNSNKNNCSTPLRMTPLAKTEGLAKLYTVTPTSVAASGSKTCSGPKWHYLTSVCSKSLTACRNKLCSPSYTISSTTTPFRLRTEERAARRKQKLEEKFNANVEEKEVHKKGMLKTKVKVHQEEKSGTELRRKLGRSFCFKARPLPDFYHHKHQADDKTEEAPSTPLKHQTSKNHGKHPPQSVKKLGKIAINMPVPKAGVRKKS